MKVEEAKKKYCPLTFAKTFEDMSLKCETNKCMWWVDEGMDNEEDHQGQCVKTAILQALYDLGKER